MRRGWFTRQGRWRIFCLGGDCFELGMVGAGLRPAHANSNATSTLSANCSAAAAPVSAAATTPAQERRSSPGRRSHVHTQRFAFRAPQVHDESVRMSNATRRRSSAPSASDDARCVVILPALSVFCEGRSAPLFHAGPAAAGISPASRRTLRPQNHQFLFDTKERSLITTRQSLITTQKSLAGSQDQPARRTS